MSDATEQRPVSGSQSPPAWISDPRVAQPTDWLDEAFRRLIWAAEGPGALERDGLAETPARAAAAWRELMAGYGPEPALTTFDSDVDEIVAVPGLPFQSTCEHHLLPFTGSADFAYLPGGRILGLSKFARVLRHYSRRLQVQEHLAAQLADRLEAVLAPRGLLVILTATHACMECRGVELVGARATTSQVRGRFRDNGPSRAEAIELLRYAS